ncbi:MAG TPA: hypothetical protein V6D18_11120 [Thermosynechococcaceae cyanobacterium]
MRSFQQTHLYLRDGWFTPDGFMTSSAAGLQFPFQQVPRLSCGRHFMGGWFVSMLPL